MLDTESYDWGAHVAKVATWLETQDIAHLSSGTAADWAWQSHRIAVDTAYDLPADLRLDAPYQAKALSVIHQQLGTAGVRLARVLRIALARPSDPRR